MVDYEGLFEARVGKCEGVGKLKAGIEEEGGDGWVGGSEVLAHKGADGGWREEIQWEVCNVGLMERLVDAGGRGIGVGARGDDDWTRRALPSDFECSFVAQVRGTASNDDALGIGGRHGKR